MPKRQIRKLELECDFCGEKEQFDLSAPTHDILPRLAKWKGTVDAGAPAGEGIPDQTKWYDSVDCLCKGVKHDEQATKLETAVGEGCGGPMLAHSSK